MINSMYRTQRRGYNYYPQYRCFFFWCDYKKEEGKDSVYFASLEQSNEFLMTQYQRDKMTLTTEVFLFNDGTKDPFWDDGYDD